MAWAVGLSVAVDSLFNVPLIETFGFCIWSLFCYAFLSVLSSFAIINLINKLNAQINFMAGYFN